MNSIIFLFGTESFFHNNMSVDKTLVILVADKKDMMFLQITYFYFPELCILHKTNS